MIRIDVIHITTQIWHKLLEKRGKFLNQFVPLWTPYDDASTLVCSYSGILRHPPQNAQGLIVVFSSLWPRQNGHHFANDIFNAFSKWKFWTFNNISLNVFPMVYSTMSPSLVQIMAWRRIGDKPLHETMKVFSTDAYMRLSVSMSFNWQ